MYQDFFSFEQLPFSATPNTEFLFFTEQHKEALAHLAYGLQGSGGFCVLTGEIGTGKTSVCQFLLRELPANTDIATITHSDITEIELLVDICEQFSVDYDRKNITIQVLFDALAKWMLDNHLRGRHAVVFIDDAQKLTFNVLEMLRMITNIEADNVKPLQIILIGQTALQKRLLTKSLRQLSQRITARYHLKGLNKQEGIDYIQYRLTRAGAKGVIFDAKTTSTISKASLGIPRVINQICDRCLLIAYTQSSMLVTLPMAKRAISETELPKRTSPLRTHFPAFIASIAVLFTAFMIYKQAPNIKDYFVSSDADTTEPIEEIEEIAVIEVSEQVEAVEEVDFNEAVDTVESIQTDENTILIAEKVKTAAIAAPVVRTETGEVPLTPPSTLLAIPADHYSLQLTTLANQQLVRNFFVKYPQLREKTYLYSRVTTGKYRYVILLGNFEGYTAAKQASEALVRDFPSIEPWIKDYRRIHDDIQ